MAQELKENDHDKAVVSRVPNLRLLREVWWHKAKTANTAKLKNDCVCIAFEAIFGPKANDNPSEVDYHPKITLTYRFPKLLLQTLIEWLSEYDGQTNNNMHCKILMLLITLTSAFGLWCISPSIISDCFDIVTCKIWYAKESTAHLGSELLLNLWLRVCCASLYIKCTQLVVIYRKDSRWKRILRKYCNL